MATRRQREGFTLIELLVVMTIIATLLTLAVPKYFSSVQRSKEAVLKQDLTLIRESLDKYYGDVGKYPDTLDDLVTRKYLRSIPRDPVTESESTWVTIPPEDLDKGVIYDVHSGAEGNGANGAPYKEW
ncbi:MAG: type II secretion system protein [Methylophilaceae bacterium]